MNGLRKGWRERHLGLSLPWKAADHVHARPRGGMLILTNGTGEEIGYATMVYHRRTAEATIGTLRWNGETATEQEAIAALERALRKE